MVLNYDVVAILISIVLLIYYVGSKKIGGFQNRVFLMLVIDNLFTALVDLYQYTVATTVIEKYTCSILYFVTHVLVLPIFFVYVLSTVYSWFNMGIGYKVITIVPAGITALLLMINPFISYIFYYDEEGSYHRGAGYPFLYICTFFYMICIFIVVIRYRSRMSKRQKLTICIAMGLVVFCMYIQFMISSIRLEIFALAYAQLLFFFNVTNPLELLDEETKLYNKRAYKDIVNHNIILEKKMALVSVILYGIEIDDTIGSTKTNDILVQLSQYINGLNKRANCFKKGDNILVAEFEDSFVSEFEEYVNDIEERLRKPFIISGFETLVEYRLCIVSVPEDVRDEKALNAIFSEAEQMRTDKKRLYASDFDITKINRSYKIEQAVTQAVSDNDINIEFTPIYSFSENRICGALATVSYFDGDAGLISEREMGWVGNSTGLYIKIYELRLRKTLEILTDESNDMSGVEVIYFRNTSLTGIRFNMFEMVYRLLGEYNVDPGRFVFLISEYMVARGGQMIKDYMEKYSKLGMRFGILDYGSGYSDIESIYGLPIEILWFTRQVLTDASVNFRASKVLDATLELAKSLNVKTIMDGISNVGEFEMIAGMECDYVLGNYISEKVNHTDLARLAGSSIQIMGGVNISDN